jgi:hypothetical protein
LGGLALCDPNAGAFPVPGVDLVGHPCGELVEAEPVDQGDDVVLVGDAFDDGVGEGVLLLQSVNGDDLQVVASFA